MSEEPVEKSPAPERVEYKRGPIDWLKVLLVYCIAAPMVLGFAGILLLMLFSSISVPLSLEFPLHVLVFLSPMIVGALVAIRRYRRWNIHQVAIDSDFIEWSRKGIKTVIPFEELSVLSGSPVRYDVRSRKGPSLTLRIPTWPIYEIRTLLEERAVPPVADRIIARVRSGETVCFNAPTNKSILQLVGGSMIAGIGLIFGIAFLQGAIGKGTLPHFGFMAFMALGAGGEMLRRFFQVYGHRVEMDSRGLRLFSLPRWKTIAWSQITSIGEDAECLKIQGAWPSPPLRLQKEIDNYSVVRKVVEKLGEIRRGTD